MVFGGWFLIVSLLIAGAILLSRSSSLALTLSPAAKERKKVRGACRLLENARSQDRSAAFVVQRDRKSKHTPCQLLFIRAWLVQQTATRPVDVRFAAVADRLDHLPPVAHQRMQFVKNAPAGEPVPWLSQVFGGSVIAILPDAFLIEYLNQDV